MKRLAIMFICLAALLAAGGGHSSADGDAAAAGKKVSIIVHVDNAVKPGDLKNDDIKQIFLKNKTTWTDTTAIKPVQLASDTDEAKTFRKSIINMSEEDLAKHWKDKRANDGVDPPASKSDSASVFRYVSKNKDAIGFVSGSYLEGLAEDDKKKIKEILTVTSN